MNFNYKQAIEYINEAGNYGIVPGLDSIKRLCHELSNPQNSLKFIHIAGTNGKGSAGAFIDSILRTAGYRTGRYVSPAVIDRLEIIQYNNNNITEDEYAFYIEKVKYAADRIVETGFPHPTAFELETAAAFCYFADKKCDVVLLEAGMGGKSDATNIIKRSIVSVITSISLEHTQFLGNTIQKITSEKAGIIKRRGKVVTITQNPSATAVILKECKKKYAQLTISKIYNIENYRFKDGVQSFDYGEIKNIKIKMLGKFQAENALLAIDTCHILNESGFIISENSILNGLYNTSWAGRFEVIKTGKPLMIIDGAHNEAAALRLRETIDISFSDSRIVYIMGMFKDKNYEAAVKLTSRRAFKIFTVTPPGKRGLDAQILAESIKQYNPNVIAMENIKDAVDKALSEKCDAVIAFGSLSFLGEIKNHVNNKVKNDIKI